MKQTKGSAVAVVIIVIVVLLIAAASVWYFVIRSGSDWKTYTNEKYGFEFKYPQNFTIQEENSGMGTMVSFGAFWGQTDSSGIRIISEKEINKLIPVWFSGVNLVKQENNKINNINWTFIYFIDQNSLEKVNALVEKNGGIYEVFVESGKLEDLNQILSTFKFTK